MVKSYSYNLCQTTGLEGYVCACVCDEWGGGGVGGEKGQLREGGGKSDIKQCWKGEGKLKVTVGELGSLHLSKTSPIPYTQSLIPWPGV